MTDVVPRKVQKAARRVLEFMEEQEAAFTDANIEALEAIAEASDDEEKTSDIVVGSILMDREPEHRRQMLIVVNMNKDGHYMVKPVPFKEDGYHPLQVTKFVSENQVAADAIHPYVCKDTLRLVLVKFDKFYKVTDDEYIKYE